MTVVSMENAVLLEVKDDYISYTRRCDTCGWSEGYDSGTQLMPEQQSGPIGYFRCGNCDVDRDVIVHLG